MEVARIAALVVYGALLAASIVYGLNNALMVAIHVASRTSRNRPPPALPSALPRLLVQLPVFNERHVVVRLLDAAAELDWPRDRLQIQLLDDSTDDTADVARPHVERLRAAGVPVEHVRRATRDGFKAGALAHGLVLAPDAELIAIFDADFVPTPDFLLRAVRWFADERVGVVQGRWTHLNRDVSALTRVQALAIDGHFGVEQAARVAAGWFLNFNGSAGIWRRAAILDAGGWSGDTLTEDLDLSYRAQLRGWKIHYDDTLACPAELPTDLASWKSQQRRWATGSMQVAQKLLPAVWRSDRSLVTKLQATLHLTHYGVHVLIALAALLSVPCVLLPGVASGGHGLWGLVPAYLVAFAGPTLLHVYSQRVLERTWVSPRDVGALSLYGMGISVSNTVAVAAAFRRDAGEFVRTPKSGAATVGRYRAPADGLGPWEAAVAVWCAGATFGLLAIGAVEVAPFLAMDAVAFATVAWRGYAEMVREPS